MKEVPKYVAIAQRLKREIEDGHYQANDQLPKELDLAKSYNVSRITIRNAMSELENDGLIYRIQGAGTFVKDKVITQNVRYDQLELINLKKYELKMLDFEVGLAESQMQKELDLRPNDIVYTIKRSANDRKTKDLVVFQKICIPAKVIQGLNMEMIETSIYPLIAKKIGVAPQKAIRNVTLAYGTKDLLKEIKVDGKVEENEPLLKWNQKSYLADGRLFEWNDTYYRISKFPIQEAIVL